MNLSDLTNYGDKIDIQLLGQIEMQARGESVGPIRTYKSSIFDYLSGNEIEIAMPTENGRMVLFQVGLRCKMLFYSKKGLYTCDGMVQKRYKKENFFVLSVMLTSTPVKFQRREFFRVDCTMDMQYFHIDESIAEMSSTEQIFEQVESIEYMNDMKKGISLDISGGGIRFVGEEKLEVGSNVLACFRLTNERIDKMFYLVTKVVASDLRNNTNDRYENRGRFLFKDLKDREAIVQFVFEEERRIRKKEIG